MEFLLKNHEDSAHTLLGEIRRRLRALEQDSCVQQWCHSDENVSDVIFRAQLMKNTNLFASKKILDSVVEYLKDTKIEVHVSWPVAQCVFYLSSA